MIMIYIELLVTFSERDMLPLRQNYDPSVPLYE
jgi:hypothetical protein